jgi:hypothetical protein
MAGRVENLKPWRKGESGNPGGRPRRKLLTDELERLLEQEAPAANGKTWAAVIAETLLKQGRKGNVRAIAEIGDRVEGKAQQSVELINNEALCSRIREGIREGRKRALAGERERLASAQPLANGC